MNYEQQPQSRRSKWTLCKQTMGLISLSAACIAASSLTAQINPEETEVIDLDAYVVRSISDGQQRALSEQRASANLISTLSSDSLGRFPDPNIAEALQRISGVGVERDQGEGRYINVRGAPKELTAVTFDGVSIPGSDPDTRAVQLDIFSSDFVQQIEVTKALRPDQDADSIAGAVNVKTPSPLQFGSRRIMGKVAGSYNDQGGNSDRRASILYSDVFGANQEFGILVGYNYSQTNREVDNVENEGWDRVEAGNREVWSFTESHFKDYETTRTRQGFNATLEYSPNDDTLFFVRAFTSELEDNEFRYKLGIIWEDGDIDEATATDRFATYTRPYATFQFRHRVKVDETQSLSAGGVHAFDNVAWDYTVALSKAKQSYPNRDELLYRMRVPSISYDFNRNPKLPNYSLFTTNEHLNFDNYSFREMTSRFATGEEDELSVATNVSISSEWFNHPAMHQFGIKLRDREKSLKANRFRDRSSAANPGPLTSFLRGEEARNYDYILGEKHDTDKVKAYLDERKPLAPQRSFTDNFLANYFAKEKILAAYAMSQFRVGEFDMVAGVRLENTSVNTEGYSYNDDTRAVELRKFKNDQLDVFPGIHAKIEMAEDLILRASITRGIARAPFADLAPYRNESPEDREVELGNPDLKPALSNNLDVSLEYYLGTGGVVSVSPFYKDLTDFVVTSRFNTQVSDGGQTLTYVATQPVNSESGHILGVELSYQQTLSFLEGALSGLGVFANIALADSETEVPFGGGKVRLPGQSDLTTNVGLYYETDRLSVQLSYNNRSEYIQDLDTINGRDYDVWWDGRAQVDLTASYQATRNIELYAEWNNLTDTKGYRYVGSPERGLEYESFGWWVNFGAKFNF